MQKKFKRGDIVCDVADARHEGIVQSIHLVHGKFYANVQWLETGFKSCRLPFADLRLAPEDTPCLLAIDEMFEFDQEMEADEACE